MVDWFLKYDSSQAGAVSTSLIRSAGDNGTQGASMYWEVYHGKNAYHPAAGDEDIDCTYWLESNETAWNSQACMAYDDYSYKVLATWDSSTKVATTYCDTIYGDCGSSQTTIQWDRITMRVSGMFLNLLNAKYTNGTYQQCVIPYAYGGSNYSNCNYFPLPTMNAQCTQVGVIAQASELTLGLAALLGALSFF